MRDPKAIASWRAENHHTEAGNAERFVFAYGEQFRYNHDANCWLSWDGTRWAVDQDGAATRLLLKGVRRLISIDPSFVLASEKRSAIEGALKIATNLRTQNGHSVRVKESALNRRRDVLPVANGVVNLRTGELMPGDPADLMTYGSRIEYDSKAEAPKFLEFLDDITCGDATMAAWLQRWFGYCATGEVREQAIVFLWGDGANGKGVLTRLIAEILGDAAITVPITTLMAKRVEGETATPSIARMAGRRLVLASEGTQDVRLDEAVVKNLTGSETIVARMLHSNPIEFEPTAKITVSTNPRPVIVGTDHGIWRRVKLVPMRADFGQPGHKPVDPQLEDRLREELPGILGWVVRGAREWYAEADQGRLGLGNCAVVTTATNDYRAEMDRVGSFIEDTYVVERFSDGSANPACRIRAAEVYQDYIRWCAANGIDPLSQNGLSRELGKRGLPVILSSGRWRGGLRRHTSRAPRPCEGQ